jgi:hypothetical protein
MDILKIKLNTHIATLSIFCKKFLHICFSHISTNNQTLCVMLTFIDKLFYFWLFFFVATLKVYLFSFFLNMNPT